MNLIEESFQKNKEENKKSNLSKIVLIAMVLVVLIIIAIMGYLAYIQNTKLKLYMDGAVNDKLKQLLVIEDGTVYVPIKEIATYFGYESYNGEYTDKSENQSKCYVQSKAEVANVSLGSNKIYKLDLTTSSSDYQYVYSDKPIKAINGVLYASSETAEKIFNIAFQYEKEKNTISIYTLPYLVQAYNSKVLDYGYTEISTVFVNQKAILNDILVVNKERKKSGVIDPYGNIILETKYDDITYLPDTGDFLVKTNNKVGILSKSKETKVQIIYDEIKLMDSDAGLYVVKKDNKYGVIDFQGNVKVHIENDEIGIDTSKFPQNNIKNKYLLADTLIPVRKDKYWGLLNKDGKQVAEFKYDNLGYIASNNRNALNLLMIPDYNVIVACKDKKYTLVNLSGEELFGIIADDIYMTISGGEKYYYIAVNDGQIDAIEYLNTRGVKTQNDNKEAENVENNSEQNNQQNENNQNDNNQQEQNENNQNDNNQQEQNEDNQNDNNEQDNQGEQDNQENDNGNDEEQQENNE